MMNNEITPTLQRILDEFEELKGQFVIDESNRIVRLIAIGTDEDDYYWVTYDGRKVHWSTCVGSIIQLKGKIDGKDYQKFIRQAELNSMDRKSGIEWSEEDVNTHKQRVTQLEGNDKFLTDICWDLN